MITIHIKGPQGSGKTVLVDQIERLLTATGKTWRERLAYWLLKSLDKPQHFVNRNQIVQYNFISPAATEALKSMGEVKFLIINGE